MAARKSKRPKDSKFTAPLIFLRKSEEERASERQSGVVKPSLKSFCGEDVRGSSMLVVVTLKRGVAARGRFDSYFRNIRLAVQKTICT